MISKLIVHGKDRAEALSLLQRALGQYQVVGPSTNIEFLKAVAGHPTFQAGAVETNFIPVRLLLDQRLFDWSQLILQQHHDELFKTEAIPSNVLAQAALFLSLREAQHSSTSGGTWSTLAFRRFGDISERSFLFDENQVKVRHVSTGIEVVVNGETLSVNPTLVSDTELISQFNDTRTTATIIPAGHKLHIFTSGKHYQLDQKPSAIDVDDSGAAGGGAAADKMVSPMPARVLEVRVKEGDQVTAGQVCCVLESMKMEINVRAGRDGVIGKVGAEKGMTVEEGQVLVVLDS